LLKSIFNTGLSKVLSLTIALIIGIIISREYGAEGKGFITILILVPTLVSTYVGFSLGEGFLYYIGNSQISKKQFNTLLFKVFGLFSMFLIVTYFGCVYFLINYEYYILPQILLMISLLFGNILKFSLKGVLKFKRFNLIQILDPLIVFFGLLAVLLYKADLKYLLWAYLFSSIVQNLLIYFAVSSSLNNNNSEIGIKHIFQYSYKVHFFAIMNFTEAKFDVLLIGYLISTSAVGVYSVSISITIIFQTVIQTSISTVLYPMLVKSSPLSRIYLTKKYFKISAALAAIFMIFTIFLGNYFIITVYGAEFSSAYIPMLILLGGALIKSPAACINSYFKSIGKPSKLYKTSIISLSVNIVLCIITIPSMGINGAALSSSISYMIFGMIMLFKFQKETGINYKEMIRVNISDIQNALSLVNSKKK
jgi:O-antigen/teichoic acid export membrane protein